MSKILILIISVCSLYSCTHKLQLPLKNGLLAKSLSTPSIKNGPYVYIYPQKNTSVYNIENATVFSILKIDSNISVVEMKGKYSISYHNIYNCKLKKGDRVKRRQIIGNVDSEGLAIAIKDKSNKNMYEEIFGNNVSIK